MEKEKKNTTETFVMFYRDFRTTTSASIRTNVSSLSHIFSSSGIKPDPKKVEAIHNANPPQNASDVKSLLGMTQYVSLFTPNYATIRSRKSYATIRSRKNRKQ